jgi:putative membrane protein
LLGIVKKQLGDKNRMSQRSGKVEKDVNASTANKLLVICVDRDNDVGEKAGISTPVIGRDACIEAAQRLALEDPEDADSNSIFSAIKTYEDLVSKGYQVEVVTIAGVKNRGVQADEKILVETRKVLEQFSANGAVIVSDGEDDESVIPVIQNVLPVVSVQRVVMKVSRSVEYSYAVFGKYLKMIAYDSRYSKFFLGVPGILLLIGGIASIFELTTEIFAVLVSILGGAFLIRAFDIDKVWSSWSKPTPMGFIRMFTVVTGVLLILSSVPAGIGAIDPELIESNTEVVEKITDQIIIGQFVAGALPILWMGMGAIFAGILLSNWIGGIPRQISDILRIIVLISLYPIILQFTNLMVHDESSFTLIPPLLGGLAATLISATILFKKYRKNKDQEMISD